MAATSSEPRKAGDEKFAIRTDICVDSRDLYAKAHRELGRLLLPRVLAHFQGSQQQAALMLGIARQTPRTKLRDLRPASKLNLEEENSDTRMDQSAFSAPHH
jgi:DNA-binding NtrC family response regulator